jgi:hypothetical protein
VNIFWAVGVMVMCTGDLLYICDAIPSIPFLFGLKLNAHQYLSLPNHKNQMAHWKPKMCGTLSQRGWYHHIQPRPILQISSRRC